jgi:hypothetical protein
MTESLTLPTTICSISFPGHFHQSPAPGCQSCPGSDNLTIRWFSTPLLILLCSSLSLRNPFSPANEDNFPAPLPFRPHPYTSSHLSPSALLSLAWHVSPHLPLSTSFLNGQRNGSILCKAIECKDKFTTVDTKNESTVTIDKLVSGCVEE